MSLLVPFIWAFMLIDGPGFVMTLPNDATASDGVVDPTIWIGIVLLMIGSDGDWMDVRLVTIIPEDTGATAEPTGWFILIWLVRRTVDWGRLMARDIFCTIWVSGFNVAPPDCCLVCLSVVCCKFTSVCAASNNLASSGGGASWMRSGKGCNVLREFICWPLVSVFSLETSEILRDCARNWLNVTKGGNCM